MHRICYTREAIMKTAVIPPLRVTAELRQAAEGVLKEGESLSGFLEASIQREIRWRRLQNAFLARAQGALEQFERTGVDYAAEDVIKELEDMLAGAKAADKSGR